MVQSCIRHVRYESVENGKICKSKHGGKIIGTVKYRIYYGIFFDKPEMKEVMEQEKKSRQMLH